MFKSYRHIDFSDVREKCGEDAIQMLMEVWSVNNDSSVSFTVDGPDAEYHIDEQYLLFINEALIELGAQVGEVIYIDFCW